MQANKETRMTIIDHLGKTVYSSHFEQSIDISNLNSGIYMLEIKQADNVYSQKFIKL